MGDFIHPAPAGGTTLHCTAQAAQEVAGVH